MMPLADVGVWWGMDACLRLGVLQTSHYFWLTSDCDKRCSAAASCALCLLRTLGLHIVLAAPVVIRLRPCCACFLIASELAFVLAFPVPVFIPYSICCLPYRLLPARVLYCCLPAPSLLAKCTNHCWLLNPEL